MKEKINLVLNIIQTVVLLLILLFLITYANEHRTIESPIKSVPAESSSENVNTQK
jgi:hypothetical protein